jgi:hypothetical protein
MEQFYIIRKVNVNMPSIYVKTLELIRKSLNTTYGNLIKDGFQVRLIEKGTNTWSIVFGNDNDGWIEDCVVTAAWLITEPDHL